MSTNDGGIGESIPLLQEDKTSQEQHGKMSALATAATMVAQMVGIGMLSVPIATGESGWIGLGLLCFCAFLTWVSANSLASVMLLCEARKLHITDYASVGEHALGRLGRIAGAFGQYSLLFGASVSFLVLMGQLSNSLVCQVPKRLFSMIYGAVALIVILIIPQLKKAKPIAVFAVSTMLTATLMIVVLSGYIDIALPSIGGGFSVYSFAFSVHASIPNFFNEMHQEQIYTANTLAYSSALVLFGVPLLVTTYVAFGSAMLGQTGTVIDTLKQWGPSAFAPAIVAIEAILVAHLLFALPIILTPICLFLERSLLANHVIGTRSFKSFLVRSILVVVVTLVAILLPYFLPLISIVSSVSVVLVVYILPAIFYLKLMKPSWAIVAGMIFLILFGLAGATLGLKNAIPALISAVEKGGNPFENFFSFGCAPGILNETARNMTCFE